MSPDRRVESEVASVDGVDVSEVSHGGDIEEEGKKVVCAVAMLLQLIWK